MLRVKRILDTFLAGTSMYLVITLALFVLFGVALTYSFVGMTIFSPIAIILSLALFMGVSFGASYVFGYLFSVKAHHKSALISGGILFCLFSPTLIPSDLLLHALIAIIAMASKYLLVWRGRHIFNPAAIAAVIVSLAGLQSASWWMADISFAIPVSLLAILILYKTERLRLGAIFIAVYLIVLALSAVVNGQPVDGLLLASLGVWWPLFFAGFMLSEPLTLPPRRYQYGLVAGIVAALVALHPSLGPVYTTPELALAFGNLVSFFMARRVGMVLRLVKREKFAGGQELFEFEPRRKLTFKAGQHLELTLPHAKTDLRGERRFFTIASAPESRTVKITTRYAKKSSTFKTQLQLMAIGQELTATGIKGDFLLPKDPTKKLLFIAGGIGITPFRSFIESLQLNGESRDVVLVYAARSSKEVLFKDLFMAEKSGVKLVVIAPDATKGDFRGEGVTKEILAKAVKDIKDRHVYISGSPAMVAGVSAQVAKLGAPSITTDSFTGY